MEPGVLVGSVIQNQLRDHPEAPEVGFLEKLFEIGEGSAVRMDVHIVGNIVSIVLPRRGVERKNPECGHSQFVKVMPVDYKRVLQARRASLRPPKRSAPRLGVVDGGKV